MKPWYQETSKLGDAFTDFHQQVSTNACLDKKTIELIKIAVSSVLRCSYCTQSHVKQAQSLGVSAAEITDTLLISSLQAAGTQLFWDKQNFERNIAGQKQ